MVYPNRLRFVREARKKTQQQMADIMRIDKNQYILMEEGEVPQDYALYRILKQNLNVPIAYIAGANYTLKLKQKDWRSDYYEDWENANKETKIMLECRYGYPENISGDELDDLNRTHIYLLDDIEASVIDRIRALPAGKILNVGAAIDEIEKNNSRQDTRLDG